MKLTLVEGEHTDVPLSRFERAWLGSRLNECVLKVPTITMIGCSGRDWRGRNSAPALCLLPTMHCYVMENRFNLEFRQFTETILAFVKGTHAQKWGAIMHAVSNNFAAVVSEQCRTIERQERMI